MRHDLTFDLVHRIRTEGRLDAYWEQRLGYSRVTIWKARVGMTWKTHPTPPDRSARLEKPKQSTRPPPQMSEQEKLLSMALAKWPRVEWIAHE